MLIAAAFVSSTALRELWERLVNWFEPDALLERGEVALHVVVLSLLGFGLARLITKGLSKVRKARRASQPDAEESADGVARPGESPVRAHLGKSIRRSLSLFFVLAFNRILLPITLDADLPDPVATWLTVGCLVGFGYFLIQAANGVRLWLDERFDISRADNFHQRRMRTQISFIEKIFDVVVVIVTAALALTQFDAAKQLGTGLLASAGVASLVIGLAAQRTLANLLAGFQIAFTAPIRIDDAVVVENEWGWIEEITLTYVVVRVWDRRRLVLPITYFVEKPFQNWTRKSGQILGSVFLEVAHHTPFEPLNQELNRLLEADPLWDGDARVLQVVEMKERSLQLRALMTARNSPECWDLRCAVRRGLVEFLVQNHPDCLAVTRMTVVDEGGQHRRHDSMMVPADVG